MWRPDRRGILRSAPPRWEARVAEWNRAIAESRKLPDDAAPIPVCRAYSRETALPFAEARMEILQACAERGMTTKEAARRVGMSSPNRLRTWLGNWPELGGPEAYAQLKANGRRR